MKLLRLCSGSPTRALILKNAGVAFEQCGCDFDEESIQAQHPRSFVYEVTLGKYGCCKERYGIAMPLLVADTVVSKELQILRKAKDENDALKMLQAQSNSRIDITTCTILAHTSFYFVDISVTSYIFHRFALNEIESYLHSGEWRGKAGACMVEGFCKKYIKNVVGLESNAMGLPVEKILPLLKGE